MPARPPRRHRLMLYTHLLNRWWHATLAIFIALLILTACAYILPRYVPMFAYLMLTGWKFWLLVGACGACLLVTILLAAIRKSACVRVFPNHIRLSTPFMSMNISAKRMLRTYSSEIQKLFPLKKIKGLRREILEPMAANIALVIEMTALPMPRWLMKQFFSPLFFPDRSPRLALLVPDWMALSAEVDSMLGRYQDSLRLKPEPPASASILSGLTGRKK